MCGIVGAASLTAMTPSSLPERMRDTMRHRGPDAAGIWWAPDGRVWLGHRRLAVIDLSPGGHQPMDDGADDIHLVFNGEIYNHRALRAELEAAGHSFRSSSDTEVLLEAYREWGTACLQHLNGMFAFALNDARRGRLFLARDRAGEKPLFYYRDPGRILFASELKALMKDPSLPRTVDLQALNHYLAYGYVPGRGCILEGFRKLGQGEAMTYELADGGLTRWTYWQLPQPSEPPPKGEGELEEELEGLLRDSVRLRLEADVPVGILLSGGIDSSLVTALAAEASPKPVRTFTIAFPGHAGFDEGPYARAVAHHFGTDHTELAADPASVDLLPELARQFDEPMADSSMIPTYLVSRLIREHATVALGGDGGDELFGGYPYYSWLQKELTVRRFLPRLLREQTSSMAASFLPIGFKGRNHLLGLKGTEAESVAYPNIYFDVGSRHRLVGSLHELGPAGLSAPEALKGSLVREDVPLPGRAMAVDFMTYLVDDILVKVDRTSMLTSLEVRAPWLDPRVIEFAFSSVPASMKATRMERKVLSRRLARRLLPSSLDLGRKQGLSLPLESWFGQEWGRYVKSVMFDDGQRLFDRDEVGRIFSLQRRGYPNAQRLFALVIFELWRRHYRVEVPKEGPAVAA